MFDEAFEVRVKLLLLVQICLREPIPSLGQIVQGCERLALQTRIHLLLKMGKRLFGQRLFVQKCLHNLVGCTNWWCNRLAKSDGEIWVYFAVGSDQSRVEVGFWGEA